MTMIKCPECRHHISSMAKACPECGCPIDPAWAEAEAKKELEKLDEVPFTVEADGEEIVTPEDRTPKAEEPEPERQEPHKAEPAPQVAEPKEASATGWFVGIVVLLGLIIGGLYFYDYRSNQLREEHAYELLQDCSNPAFYDDFMARFPKSKYIDDVRRRYKVVAAQQNEWQRLVTQGTRDQLHAFVRQHPTSPYVKMAQDRIDSLDWASAKESRKLEAVTHYLAVHPDGFYIDKAEILRQQLEREKAQAEARRAAARRDSLARLDSLNSISVSTSTSSPVSI